MSSEVPCFIGSEMSPNRAQTVSFDMTYRRQICPIEDTPCIYICIYTYICIYIYIQGLASDCESLPN